MALMVMATLTSLPAPYTGANGLHSPPPARLVLYKYIHTSACMYRPWT